MRRKVLDSAMRGKTVILTTQRQNQSIDAENVCRGKNFNKEPRAPLNLNQMNYLSDGLNHRRIKWPSADYTQQTMSTLHHRHEWATRGEHTHPPDKSAVGVLDASTCNFNAQRSALLWDGLASLARYSPPRCSRAGAGSSPADRG
jgi:hypothetical protein